jgi:ABC-2 type transport system permease protein
MADKVKMLLCLYRTYGRMDLMWFLRDTKYCLLQIFTDLVSTGAAMAGVFVLARRFGSIGGMTQDQLLFMLGYAMLGDGIFSLFFIGYNFGQISRTIGRGQLDHNMIQPVPLWMQLMTGGFSPVSGSSILLCGIILTVYAAGRLGIAITLGWVLLLLLSILASVVIFLSFVFLISCIAFWAPVAAEESASLIHGLFGSLKRYPLGGMAVGWQAVFCSLVPVGLAGWFPSLWLMGDGTPAPFFPVLTFVMALLFGLLAVRLFKKGMKHYATCGSPRYSGFGHR